VTYADRRRDRLIALSASIDVNQAWRRDGMAACLEERDGVMKAAAISSVVA